MLAGFLVRATRDKSTREKVPDSADTVDLLLRLHEIQDSRNTVLFWYFFSAVFWVFISVCIYATAWNCGFGLFFCWAFSLTAWFCIFIEGWSLLQENRRITAEAVRILAVFVKDGKRIVLKNFLNSHPCLESFKTYWENMEARDGGDFIDVFCTGIGAYFLFGGSLKSAMYAIRAGGLFATTWRSMFAYGKKHYDKTQTRASRVLNRMAGIGSGGWHTARQTDEFVESEPQFTHMRHFTRDMGAWFHRYIGTTPPPPGPPGTFHDAQEEVASEPELEVPPPTSAEPDEEEYINDATREFMAMEEYFWGRIKTFSKYAVFTVATSSLTAGLHLGVVSAYRKYTYNRWLPEEGNRSFENLVSCSSETKTPTPPITQGCDPVVPPLHPVSKIPPFLTRFWTRNVSGFESRDNPGHKRTRTINTKGKKTVYCYEDEEGNEYYAIYSNRHELFMYGPAEDSFHAYLRREYDDEIEPWEGFTSSAPNYPSVKTVKVDAWGTSDDISEWPGYIVLWTPSKSQVKNSRKKIRVAEEKANSGKTEIAVSGDKPADTKIYSHSDLEALQGAALKKFEDRMLANFAKMHQEWTSKEPTPTVGDKVAKILKRDPSPPKVVVRPQPAEIQPAVKKKMVYNNAPIPTTVFESKCRYESSLNKVGISADKVNPYLVRFDGGYQVAMMYSDKITFNAHLLGDALENKPSETITLTTGDRNWDFKVSDVVKSKCHDDICYLPKPVGNFTSCTLKRAIPSASANGTLVTLRPDKNNRKRLEKIFAAGMVAEGGRHSMPTEVGDCGSPVIALSAPAPEIWGIHQSGADHNNTNGYIMFTPELLAEIATPLHSMTKN